VKRSGTKVALQRLVRWIFGHDEYANGRHIAHEPSWWQRRKARQDTEDWLWSRIPSVIEINLTANAGREGTGNP